MTNFDELATDLAKAEEELAAAQREIARLRDATGANITDLRAVAALLEERFVSGNSVDITHVRLSKAEWARLAGAVEGTALALAAAQLRIEELEVQFKEMNDHRIELFHETLDLRGRIAVLERERDTAITLVDHFQKRAREAETENIMLRAERDAEQDAQLPTQRTGVLEGNVWVTETNPCTAAEPDETGSR